MLTNSNVNPAKYPSNVLGIIFNIQLTYYTHSQTNEHRQKKNATFFVKLQYYETLKHATCSTYLEFSFTFNYCNIQNVNSNENLFIFICIFYCMSGRILFSEQLAFRSRFIYLGRVKHRTYIFHICLSLFEPSNPLYKCIISCSKQYEDIITDTDTIINETTSNIIYTTMMTSRKRLVISMCPER